MNLSKMSNELYRNGMYEIYDDSIDPKLFNHVPVDENKYVPADWVLNKSNVTTIDGNYKKIGDLAFCACYNLTNVNLPVCEYVGERAFRNCTSLTNVSLPVCSYVGSYAFNRCYSLTSIDLPVCEYVGSCAFLDCSSLTEINLPACENVEINAFGYCTSLTSISLPVCENVGSNAFKNCEKLESIYLTNSSVVTLYDINAFYSTPMSNSSYLGHFGSIYVPSSLLSKYQSATNWSVYSSRFAGI